MTKYYSFSVKLDEELAVKMLSGMLEGFEYAGYCLEGEEPMEVALIGFNAIMQMFDMPPAKKVPKGIKIVSITEEEYYKILEGE